MIQFILSDAQIAGAMDGCMPESASMPGYPKLTSGTNYHSR